MKLATLKNGSRDGQLVVVNRSLTRAIVVSKIAPTLQNALDRWHQVSPLLLQISDQLNQDANLEGSFDFDQQACHSPLPRAYAWCDGSAYVRHIELVRKARGATMPDNFWTEPLMYQGGSDRFIGPYDDIVALDEQWGIDFEAEVCVITDDVPMAVSHEAAAGHIKLLMLCNDVSLRHLIPDELAKNFGFFQSKPASSFSPIALTPDELGDTFSGGKVHLPLRSYLNGDLFGYPNAGLDMTFSFLDLIVHATKTRELGAGAIIGSGTVSNQDEAVGSSCLAEKRTLQSLKQQPQSDFLHFGDRVRIEMLDERGQSLFGTIDQKVVAGKL